jgi:hypothetical protein
MTINLNTYFYETHNNHKIHSGNGAKDELKKENKNYNFKFYYRMDKKIKFCSAGFNTIDEFKQLIEPINDKYYIFEYMMENKKCLPYFDYEYEISKQLTKKELSKQLTNIILLIKNAFSELFNVQLDDKHFKIASSHGFKKENVFKVSFHITIIDYYFDNNYECKYLCDILSKKDNNFDTGVYSKDRTMRTVLSCKDWNDSRKFQPIDCKHKNINITINEIDDYLITNVKDSYIKLIIKVPIKAKIIKQNYKPKHNILTESSNNEIGAKLEQLVKLNYNEDAYFTKSVYKSSELNPSDENNITDITFYAFNYNDRNKKCFTGNLHDRLGFYCYVDNLNNVILKCFSCKCKKCKYIIGNLNDSIHFKNTLDINEKYATNSKNAIQTMNDISNTPTKSFVLKSSMGTGKTDMLIKYINKNKPKRIILISTRQSYANNVHKRLDGFNFVNYLDNKKTFHEKDRIIVQIESMHYLTRELIKPFDLVILDEIESITYHFSSETLATNGLENTFDLLHTLCKPKKTKVIALDADYNIRSHDFIKSIGNFKMVHNLHKNDVIKIELTDQLDFFVNDIINSIKEKQKIHNAHKRFR